jgi:hypothetical protein
VKARVPEANMAQERPETQLSRGVADRTDRRSESQSTRWNRTDTRHPGMCETAVPAVLAARSSEPVRSLTTFDCLDGQCPYRRVRTAIALVG